MNIFFAFKAIMNLRFKIDWDTKNKLRMTILNRRNNLPLLNSTPKLSYNRIKLRDLPVLAHLSKTKVDFTCRAGNRK